MKFLNKHSLRVPWQCQFLIKSSWALNFFHSSFCLESTSKYYLKHGLWMKNIRLQDMALFFLALWPHRVVMRIKWDDHENDFISTVHVHNKCLIDSIDHYYISNIQMKKKNQIYVFMKQHLNLSSKCIVYWPLNKPDNGTQVNAFWFLLCQNTWWSMQIEEQKGRKTLPRHDIRKGNYRREWQ